MAAEGIVSTLPETKFRFFESRNTLERQIEIRSEFAKAAQWDFCTSFMRA